MTNTFGQPLFITKRFSRFAAPALAASDGRSAGSIRFDGKN
jgi:hypothetical protein